MRAYLKTHCKYVRNTGNRISMESFDEDWEPIGMELRMQLQQENLIYYNYEDRTISLTEKGMQYAND